METMNYVAIQVKMDFSNPIHNWLNCSFPFTWYGMSVEFRNDVLQEVTRIWKLLSQINRRHSALLETPSDLNSDVFRDGFSKQRSNAHRHSLGRGVPAQFWLGESNWLGENFIWVSLLPFLGSFSIERETSHLSGLEWQLWSHVTSIRQHNTDHFFPASDV